MVGTRLLRLKSEVLNIAHVMPLSILEFSESSVPTTEETKKLMSIAGASAAANLVAGLAKMKTSPAYLQAPQTTMQATIANTTAGDRESAYTSAAVTSFPTTTTTTDSMHTARSTTFPLLHDNIKLFGDVRLDVSEVAVKSLVVKTCGRAKRKVQRKMALAWFVKQVQASTTAAQLLALVDILDNAIPTVYKFVYNKETAPSYNSYNTGSITCAMLAVRVFILDRSICYDMLEGVESASAFCQYKLRTQFAPRCMISPNCSQFLGHMNKCIYVEQVTRYPFIRTDDQKEREPYPTVMRSNPTSIPVPLFPTGPPPDAIVPAFKRKMGELTLRQYRRLLLDRDIAVDIEGLHPFVPDLKDCMVIDEV